jgi:hypothetical protein
MRFFQPWFLFPAFFLLLLGGCSGFVFFSNGRALVVVTVDPTIADPNNFPNFQVQFRALGTFNLAPTFLDPLPNVVWTVDRPAFSRAPDLGHASINQNGIARCTPGFVGTVTVIATAPADPSFPVSASNQVTGTAQMRCP